MGAERLKAFVCARAVMFTAKRQETKGKKNLVGRKASIIFAPRINRGIAHYTSFRSVGSPRVGGQAPSTPLANLLNSINMGYSVLHIEKGTAGKAGGLGSHIERTKHVLNADPARTPYNVFVHELGGKVYISKMRREGTLQQRIDGRIKEGYKGKTAIRKDAVTHLNIVMTGSHEEMMLLGKNRKLGDWVKANYDFARKEFGAQNIVEFAVHLDERTPHIHCVVVPLTEDGRLSAKEVMGDRVKMSARQDRYGMAMEGFGLQRGVKGSTATHDSVREFYGRIDKALSTEVEIPAQNITIPEIAEPPLAPWKHKDWAKSQNKAIREAFKLSVGNTATEIKKCAEEQIKTASAQVLEGERQARSLQSMVTLLERQVDELRYPEKYEEQRRQRAAAKAAREAEIRQKQEQAAKRREEAQGRKRGGFRR